MIVAILYNSVGCELARVESDHIGDVMSKVDNWLMTIQNGDYIKFEK